MSPVPEPNFGAIPDRRQQTLFRLLPGGGSMRGTDRTAVAWWIENDGDQQHLCYDTERGETVAVDITDANFGGEVPK